MPDASQPAVRLRVVQSVDPALPVGLSVIVPHDGGVIGRAETADVCLPGNTVSRAHAALRASEHGWSLEPLTSTNAVFIDGSPTLGAALLAPGITFQLGGVVCMLVDDAGTTPVLQRLDQPVLLEVHDDGGRCTVHAGGLLLPIPPQEAALLGALIASAGRPVHRWDLLELLGDNTNLDKVVSKLRSGLKQALQDGVLDGALLAAELGQTLDPAALAHALIVTRRGHGYLLALAPHRVRRVQV